MATQSTAISSLSRLQRDSYARLTYSRKLPAALEEAERLRRKMQTWPSKNSRGDGRGLIGVMDDELGFVD